MIRPFFAFAALGTLVACGDGNPFTTTPGGSTVGTVNGSELDQFMTANSLTYNDNGTPGTADDTLIINNLPFDSSDLTGGEYTQSLTLPNGFEVYESPASGGSGTRQYFAVFQRSDHTQALATATNDYVDAGFGGIIAERIGSGTVPAARPASYTFTGQYAGPRVYRGGGIADAGYVTGDATLFVDVLDFDTTGAVEGVITNRSVYTLGGVLAADLDDFISLATAEINFENATLNSSTATLQDSTTGLQLGSNGSWSGVFGGNGEEIAGIIVIDGTPAQDEIDTFTLPSGVTVRENGAFIVLNDE